MSAVHDKTDSVKESVQKAVKVLSEIVIDKCEGFDNYHNEKRQILQSHSHHQGFPGFKDKNIILKNVLNLEDITEKNAEEILERKERFGW